MLPGLYSAATAMDAAIFSQSFSAENLAHANVPGYRARGAIYGTFENTLEQTVPDSGNSTDSRYGVQSQGGYTNFTPGPLQATGNPLDVAAVDSTYFVVSGPNGDFLTRNGTFRLNEANQIVNSSGYTVRGVGGGAITLPPNTVDITISQDGTLSANGQKVDQLLLAYVPQPGQLTRAGTTLFSGGVPSGTPVPGTVRVEQGYREGSNVQIIPEMVSMLTGARHYETAERALRSLSEAMALNTRPTNQ